MQKLLDQFSHNLVERWHMSCGRSHWSLVIIWIAFHSGYGTIRVTIRWGGHHHTSHGRMLRGICFI